MALSAILDAVTERDDIDQLVALLYDAILQRPPDPAGAHGWAEAIESGQPAKELIAGLLGTEEARRRSAGRVWFPGAAGAHEWRSSAMKVTDVGAAPLDYEDDIYAPLMQHPDSALVCFEPDPERAARARAKHERATIVEACIADGSNRSFFETHVGVTSSLFAPNSRAAVDLAEVGDEMEIAEVRHVDTVRLDDVDAAQGTHYLKIDVQGGEVDVITHGRSVVSDALAVHAEVEFYPLYIDQPLGWQVWQALDAAGFDLYWFDHLQTYTMRSSKLGHTPPGRRIGWGDAVFFPKVDRMLQLSTEDAHRLLSIWIEVYGAIDLCSWFVEQHPDPEVQAMAALLP